MKFKIYYDNLDYKILGVDHAVDIIAIMINKENYKIKIPIIDRKYAPLGFALLEFNINDGLDEILNKINKESFAMSRHKEMLIESIENLELFNNYKALS